MFNSGRHKVDQSQVCYLEAIAHKDKVLEKTLRAVDDISLSLYLSVLSSRHFKPSNAGPGI